MWAAGKHPEMQGSRQGYGCFTNAKCKQYRKRVTDNWDTAARAFPSSPALFPLTPAPALSPFPNHSRLPELCREKGAKPCSTPPARALPLAAQAEAAPSPESSPQEDEPPEQGWALGFPCGRVPISPRRPQPGAPQGS